MNVPATGISVRRLGVGDEDVVSQLAERTPRTTLLADDRTIFLAAFAARDPVGLALAYELPRRHGDEAILFVYEVDVVPAYRRRGIATQLLAELAAYARRRGIGEGFLLAEPGNDAANALYDELGGERADTVLWSFRFADT